MSWSLFERVDVGERHLDSNPEHGRPDALVVARHVVRNGEMDRAVDLPPFDGQTGEIPKDVLTTKFTVLSDDRFCESQNRFPNKHIPEYGI